MAARWSYLRRGVFKAAQISALRAPQDERDRFSGETLHRLLVPPRQLGAIHCERSFLEQEKVVREMKAWRVGFWDFLVLIAAVRNVTSLEEELADSIFGELPVHPHPLLRTTAV